MAYKPTEQLIEQSEALTEVEYLQLYDWYWKTYTSTSSRVQERRRRAYNKLEQER